MGVADHVHPDNHNHPLSCQGASRTVWRSLCRVGAVCRTDCEIRYFRETSSSICTATDEPVEFQTVLDVGKSTDRHVQDWTVTTGVRVYSPDVARPVAVVDTDKPERAMQ